VETKPVLEAQRQVVPLDVDAHRQASPLPIGQNVTQQSGTDAVVSMRREQRENLCLPA